MDPHNAPPNPAVIGRRRESRLRVRLPARLITLEGTVTALMADISEHGAHLCGDLPAVRRGADVVLQWAGGEAFGAVVWIGQRQWGVQFHDPLSTEEIRKARTIDAREGIRDAREDVRQTARAFVQGRARL
jgi:hypothetical protein